MICQFLPAVNDYEEILIDWKNELDLDEIFDCEIFDAFVALSCYDEPIGFIQCAFVDEILKVGIGLLSNSLGKGIGFDFIVSSIEFVQEHYDYSGNIVKTILKREDNHSIKVFERVGFSIVDENDEYVELEIDV